MHIYICTCIYRYCFYLHVRIHICKIMCAISVCMYRGIHVCTYIYVDKYIQIYVCIYKYRIMLCTFMSASHCMCQYQHAVEYLDIPPKTHIYVVVCIYIHSFLYTDTHTYTNMSTPHDLQYHQYHYGHHHRHHHQYMQAVVHPALSQVPTQMPSPTSPGRVLEIDTEIPTAPCLEAVGTQGSSRARSLSCSLSLSLSLYVCPCVHIHIDACLYG